MKKYKITIILLSSISMLSIGGWYTFTEYELRKSELEYLEYSEKPMGMIGFWSEAEIPISIRLTFNDGQTRWVPISSGGGFAGSFDAGKIKIERVYEEEVMATFDLILENDTEVNFNVFEDRFEPRY
jgi:hypothetical protein